MMVATFAPKNHKPVNQETKVMNKDDQFENTNKLELATKNRLFTAQTFSTHSIVNGQCWSAVVMWLKCGLSRTLLFFVWPSNPVGNDQ